MIATVKRIGNSLGLILPSHILKHFGIQVAAQIEVKVKGNEIILVPIHHEDIQTLAQLFEGYQGDYVPTLEDDKPVGDEVW
jgi:antitoxin component of MazEF toxin-antitoxin module